MPTGTRTIPNPFRLADLANTLALTIEKIRESGGEVTIEYTAGSVAFTLAGEPCAICGHFVIAGAMCLYCFKNRGQEQRKPPEADPMELTPMGP